MIFGLIGKHYENAKVQVGVKLFLETKDRELLTLYYFECSGLDVHNLARSAKKLLLKTLKTDYGNAHPEGQRIYARKWEVFVRTLLNTHMVFHNNEVSETDYHTIMRENLCGIIEEAFDKFRDGELLTVTFLCGSQVQVDGYHEGTDTKRTQSLGNVNADAQRRRLYKLFNLKPDSP